MWIKIKAFAAKVWDITAMFNIGIGVLTLGVWWTFGPIMIYLSIWDSPDSASIFTRVVVFVIGLYFTANVATVMIDDWRM